MAENRKIYQFTLRTMAPVHIGSGDTYTAKEYIYEKGHYYFPDMGQLYQKIEELGPRTTAAFESFLMSSGNYHNVRNPRLTDFLQQQQIKDRDFGGYAIKETGFEGKSDPKDPKGYLNEVSVFVRDSYGNPYIPGSSLKGAIRTILVNQHFQKTEIPWGAKRDMPFDDVFHHIRVSDSEPVSPDKLILAQKWDYSAKKSNTNQLPIHRECLKPFTVVTFTITAIGDEANALISRLGTYASAHYKAYTKKFLTDFPETYRQKTLQYPIYLGAGSGFWTKTLMDKADPSRHRTGKMKMQGNGVLKLTKAPNVKYKVNGEVRDLTDNPENLYEFGKCFFAIKEIEQKEREL